MYIYIYVPHLASEILFFWQISDYLSVNLGDSLGSALYYHNSLFVLNFYFYSLQPCLPENDLINHEAFNKYCMSAAKLHLMLLV